MSVDALDTIEDGSHGFDDVDVEYNDDDDDDDDDDYDYDRLQETSSNNASQGSEANTRTRCQQPSCDLRQRGPMP